METLSKKRRIYGEHLTPIQIFEEFILPEIKDKLHLYIWVDLFAGEGNLILPILELIPENEKINFFKKHIFLFDLQQELVEQSIQNAIKYGIPKEIAEQNITQRDTIKDYPKFILNFNLPVYHITNPPYLYLGYIAKHKETEKYLEYFKNHNEGYQDLYQIGLINDLRHRIKKMIYIIPTNFIFGFSVSNKIRKDFLKYYIMQKTIIFEKEIFEFTGTNVMICFFERKNIPANEILTFKGIKINKEIKNRIYTLDPKNYYRAGNDFEDFVNFYQAKKPLKINFYFDIQDVEKNKGDYEIAVIDVNAFNGKEYEKKKIYVSDKLYHKIKSNILFVKTVDTGSVNGRAGLYKIKDDLGVDGILVTKARYRTHPIQILIYPKLSQKDQILLLNYFNLILEYFREKADSEFMTTYKYSNSEYTRKYLGLSQVKKLIQTFPLLTLKNDEKIYFENLVEHSDRIGTENNNVVKLISFVKKKNENPTNPLEKKFELWP